MSEKISSGRPNAFSRLIDWWDRPAELGHDGRDFLKKIGSASLLAGGFVGLFYVSAIAPWSDEVTSQLKLSIKNAQIALPNEPNPSASLTQIEQMTEVARLVPTEQVVAVLDIPNP